METFLYIVFFLSCLVLIVAVLLQPGKTDAGALFTSGVSSASMNPRGTASVLSKLTIVTATIFMLTALLLSLPALTGNRSVLETEGGNNVTTPNANTNTANTANTSNSANSNSNAANTSEEKKDSEKSEDKKSESKDAEKKSDEKTEQKSDEKADESKDKAEEKKDEKKEENK